MKNVRETLERIHASDSAEAKAIAEFLEDALDEDEDEDEVSQLSTVVSSIAAFREWLDALQTAAAVDRTLQRLWGSHDLD